MSSLAQRIAADMTTAMKQKEMLRVSTLRLLRSEIQYTEKANLRPATDDDVIAVIRKGIKQRQDSIDLYDRGGRADLADKERAEAEILQEYLPLQLDAAEIRAVVRAVVAQTAVTGPAAMGPVMRASMEQLRDRADGRTVQAIVREELSARGG